MEVGQEPVNGIDVISLRSTPREPCVLDQRPDRPPGVKFCRDAAQQIVNLASRLSFEPSGAKLHGPDLIAVHRRSRAAWPGRRH
jgi:hypothetical protein